MNRPERIALLAILAGSVSFDLVGYFSAPDADPTQTVVSITTTLTFALYLWSPWSPHRRWDSQCSCPSSSTMRSPASSPAAWRPSWSCDSHPRR
ncbi:hypothetical protein [Microbacterium sp. NIBRBAC000506063]|uniref:hypothetical protein n=1 Tax=Microbacterium sp. NIBRBAC000506063 TaxID=2734618 RepID=UPI001CB740C2|nr:hypothetical protein [Microbacterium sp. NIBRBAC000506063]